MAFSLNTKEWKIRENDLVDVLDIVFFFLLGGGKEESEAPGGGGGDFLEKIPGRGGGVARGWAGAGVRGAGRVFVGNLGGGGGG